jgi:hypothetical protein
MRAPGDGGERWWGVAHGGEMLFSLSRICRDTWGDWGEAHAGEVMGRWRGRWGRRFIALS